MSSQQVRGTRRLDQKADGQMTTPMEIDINVDVRAFFLRYLRSSRGGNVLDPPTTTPKSMDPRSDLPQKDILETGPTLRVLEAIVDTLMDGAPPELAVELREGLPDPLKAAARPYNGEAPATVGEFLDRFRQRAHLKRGEDVLHKAQIAVALVDDMLPGSTVEDLRASFPVEFHVLFERPSKRPVLHARRT